VFCEIWISDFRKFSNCLFVSFGAKVTSLLFSPAPLRRALEALDSHWTDVRCWAFRPPPPDRFPRMLVMFTGIFVRLERPMAMRRSWPPPSRVVPSRCMGGAIAWRARVCLVGIECSAWRGKVELSEIEQARKACWIDWRKEVGEKFANMKKSREVVRQMILVYESNVYRFGHAGVAVRSCLELHRSPRLSRVARFRATSAPVCSINVMMFDVVSVGTPHGLLVSGTEG
jgi:hypothetical protein